MCRPNKKPLRNVLSQSASCSVLLLFFMGGGSARTQNTWPEARSQTPGWSATLGSAPATPSSAALCTTSPGERHSWRRPVWPCVPRPGGLRYPSPPSLLCQCEEVKEPTVNHSTVQRCSILPMEHRWTVEWFTVHPAHGLSFPPTHCFA